MITIPMFPSLRRVREFFAGEIRRRSVLNARLEYMSILRTGIDPSCAHQQLHVGLLERDEFFTDQGDDVLCSCCGQVWAATQEMEYFLSVGSAPPLNVLPN